MKNSSVLLLVVSFLLYGQSIRAEEKSDIAGMIVPLTGFVAEYGKAVQVGVEMYEKEHPDKCKGLSFKWEDGQYIAANTLSAYRKFIGLDSQIQYVWGSAPAEVLAPVAQSSSFPLFVLGEPETVANRPFVFNLTNPAWEYSKYLLEELRRQGLKKFAIVKAEYVYFERLIDGLKRFLQPGEEIEVLASFQADETNFRSTIAKLRGAQFDAIGIYLNPAQSSAFFRQMSEQKIKLTAFGSTNFGSTTVIKDSGGKMEGALFAQTAVQPSFQRRFEESFGDPSYVATTAQSYDMAHILCALPRGLRGKAVIGEIDAFPSFQGASGKVSLMGNVAEGKYFRFPITVNRIRDGKVETISTDGERAEQ